MKKIISLLLIVVMVFSMTAFASAAVLPNDTLNSKNKEAIDTLYGLGILEGYGNGKYGPWNTLTRAEACSIIVRAMVSEDLIYESRTDTFNDVDYFAWYRADVDTAYRNNYMHGYGDGTFGPNDSVSYAQFATIVLNMLGYNVPKLPGTWPENAVEYANYLNLYYNVSKHNNNDAIYREDVAQMLYNALDCDMVKWVNGRIIKTGETLGEYLTDNYYGYPAKVVDFYHFDNYVKYWLEDSTVGYCEYKNWDSRIEVGDYVYITLDYLGRTVSVDWYYTPEVRLEDEPRYQGIVEEVVRENDVITNIKIAGIGYLPCASDMTNHNNDNVSFEPGVYVLCFFNSNGVVGHIEFYAHNPYEVSVPIEP